MTLADATSTVTNQLESTGTSSTLTIPAASIAAGRMVNLHVFRDPGDGSDTYADSANLHGVQITYTENRI